MQNPVPYSFAASFWFHLSEWRQIFQKRTGSVWWYPESPWHPVADHPEFPWWYAAIFQFALVLTASAFFIFPVCGKALFGYIIHPLAAYLHFYPLAFVAHQSYVKCLIAVGFRMAYPVAQAVWVRFINLGYGYVYVKALVEFFFRILGQKMIRTARISYISSNVICLVCILFQME